jgi:hypothetical protein
VLANSTKSSHCSEVKVMSYLSIFFLLFSLGCVLFVSDAFVAKPFRSHTRTSAIYAASTDNANFKLLVLGGTGFVGRELVRRARQKGYTVVSISRRGKLTGETDESVTWVSGDASNQKTVQAIIDDFGPFDGCVHAVGLLLDTESGLSALNKFASGSGSTPTSESTYDKVTRQTVRG